MYNFYVVVLFEEVFVVIVFLKLAFVSARNRFIKKTLIKSFCCFFFFLMRQEY